MCSQENILVCSVVFERLKEIAVLREAYENVLWEDVIEKLEKLKNLSKGIHTHEEYLEVFDGHNESFSKISRCIAKKLWYMMR